MTRKPDKLKESFRRELDKLASKQPDPALLDAFQALAGGRDDGENARDRDDTPDLRRAPPPTREGPGDGGHNAN